MTDVQLRPYQAGGEDSARAALKIVKAVLLVSPTGSGKTVLFSSIAKKAASFGRRSLILAHRDALIKQASRKLSDNSVDHGIIMAGYTPKPHCNVQVGSVQTVVRRVRKRKFNFDLIIADEAHLSVAKSYREIIEAIPEAKLIGVTGTPCRLDGKGLGRCAGGIYDELIIVATIKEMIDGAYLVRPVVYAPQEQLDLSGVSKSKGDFDEKELAAVVDNSRITGSAVEHYKRICPDVPAIAWCVNIKHAEHVAEEFNAAGIAAKALHGGHDGAERDEAMHMLETGELKVIVFCQLLIEGVDCPAIRAIIMLRPTYSLTSYLQVIGRGLRTIYADGYDLDDQDQRFASIEASGKNCCYILDHAGLTYRHGFADEDRDWSLEGVDKRKKKKKDAGPAINVRQCPECWHMFTPAPVCPKCGHVMPTNERVVEQVEGELVELTPDMIAHTKRVFQKRKHAAKTLEELQSLAVEAGYSPRWADVQWGLKQKIRNNREFERQQIMKSYGNHY